MVLLRQRNAQVDPRRTELQLDGVHLSYAGSMKDAVTMKRIQSLIAQSKLIRQYRSDPLHLFILGTILGTLHFVCLKPKPATSLLRRRLHLQG